MRHRKMALWRAWLGSLLLCMYASVAQALPENGWWWNPEESGRGYFIEVQNGVLFMAAYFYEADGRATWLVSGGPIAGDAYTGRLLRATGGQTLFGPYNFPTGSEDAGEVRLAFADQTHGTLTWPGGVTPIERQVIGVPTAEFDPTGWWWNPDESGRGFSVEIRGTTLFMAAFMYDGAGNPVWYISSGQMATPTQFEGTLLQIGGGQTLDGPYQEPTSVSPVGSVAIDFESLDDATFTFSDAVPATAAAPEVSRKAPKIQIIRGKRQIGRFPPQPPALLPSQIMFQGRFAHYEKFYNRIAPIDTTFTYESTTVRWVQGTGYDEPVPLVSPDLGAPGTLYFYLSESSSPVKLVFTEQVRYPDGVCDATATYNRLLTSNDGSLWVNLTTRRYQGEIRMNPFGVVDWVRICKFPGGMYTQRWQQLVGEVWFKFEGTGTLIPPAFNGDISRLLLKDTEPEPPQQTDVIFQIITGNWAFAMVAP